MKLLPSVSHIKSRVTSIAIMMGYGLGGRVSFPVEPIDFSLFHARMSSCLLVFICEGSNHSLTSHTILFFVALCCYQYFRLFPTAWMVGRFVNNKLQGEYKKKWGYKLAWTTSHSLSCKIKFCRIVSPTTTPFVSIHILYHSVWENQRATDGQMAFWRLYAYIFEQN
jgi:hypothetical protein